MPQPHFDRFWQVLHSAAAPTGDAGLADVIAEALARKPISHIGKFQSALMELSQQALTWDLWDAADIIFQPWGASTDTFVYFRLWLVWQGRDVFEQAVIQPDSLADNAFIRNFAVGPLRGRDTRSIEMVDRIRSGGLTEPV